MKQTTFTFLVIVAGALILAAMTFPSGFRLPSFARTAGGQSAAASDPPASPGLRQPHLPPRPGEVRELTIKQLGNFIYDPAAGRTIPDDVRRLSGLTVRLQGFMMAPNQTEQVTHFVLVPSLFSCCFGQPPGVEHMIMVDCSPSQQVQYVSGLVSVQGPLTVQEIRDQGYVIGLFHVTGQEIRPVP